MGNKFTQHVTIYYDLMSSYALIQVSKLPLGIIKQRVAMLLYKSFKIAFRNN